jgi:hypothetical protein
LIKVEGFDIFESIRKKKDGGTVVVVHKSAKYDMSECLGVMISSAENEVN